MKSLTFVFAVLLGAVVLLVCPASVSPVAAQDASDMLLRMNRLENQVRQMSGQIEQLQFENKRLQDQLIKFQKDVEFRFQDMQPQKPQAAQPAPTAPRAAPAPATPPAPGQKRSDAFDPSADPNAPGAPRPLGSLAGQAADGAIASGTGLAGVAAGGVIAATPDEENRRGPLDLSAIGRGVPSDMPQGALPGELPPEAAPATAGGVAALTPPRTPREEYDAAYGLLQQKQYAEAEMAFRSFVQANPRDPNVPNATQLLGDTYLRRNMHADAAEQYLKVYQTWPTSAIAPESLYKLGLALKGLGQKEQACATLGEVNRRYTTTSQGFKATVEREIKRTC
jgi:tol-pal system protein YbgF